MQQLHIIHECKEILNIVAGGVKPNICVLARNMCYIKKILWANLHICVFPSPATPSCTLDFEVANRCFDDSS